MLEGYTAAVFDCDGVLLDSTEAKIKAFAATLADESPEAVQTFLAFQRSNWGVSRYKSLKWFYGEVLRDVNADAKTAAAVTRFGAFSRKALLDCPEMPGTRAYLTALQRADIPTFVVTGGDEEEVNAVFAVRGLSRFFKRVLGSPRSKSDNIRLLMSGFGIVAPAMFFGDARADYEAATSCGLDFTLIRRRSDWAEGTAVCKKANCPIFEDLSAALQG